MFLFTRWIINALALLAATNLIPGVHVRSFYSALWVALILGFLNAVARPILVFLTLPITVLSLGLFIFIINALLVWFTASIVKGFDVSGFGPALLLGIFMWLVSVITNWLLIDRGNI
ncbi:MAG: phage holin family protein [bacterium]